MARRPRLVAVRTQTVRVEREPVATCVFAGLGTRAFCLGRLTGLLALYWLVRVLWVLGDVWRLHLVWSLSHFVEGSCVLELLLGVLHLLHLWRHLLLHRNSILRILHKTRVHECVHDGLVLVAWDRERLGRSPITAGCALIFELWILLCVVAAVLVLLSTFRLSLAWRSLSLLDSELLGNIIVVAFVAVPIDVWLRLPLA